MPNWARQYRKHGFNMIATGTDQGILMAGIRSVLQSIGEQVMTFKVGVTRDLRDVGRRALLRSARLRGAARQPRTSPGNGCREDLTEITPDIAARYDGAACQPAARDGD